MKFINIEAPVILSVKDMGALESMSIDDIHTLSSFSKWGMTALNSNYVYKIFHKPNTSFVVYNVNSEIYGTPYILELFDNVKSASNRYSDVVLFLNE